MERSTQIQRKNKRAFLYCESFVCVERHIFIKAVFLMLTSSDVLSQNLIKIPTCLVAQRRRIERPYDAVVIRILIREEQSYPERLGEIQEAGWRTIVLHQRYPFN